MKSLVRALPALLVCHLALAQNPPTPSNQAQAPVPQAPGLTAPQGKVAQSAGLVDITQEPIVKIVANVQPAVVNINAEETVPNTTRRMTNISACIATCGSGRRKASAPG